MLCDPIHRLLSDFKHVTYDWGDGKIPNVKVNRQFIGPDSVLYPFQNMSFDQMVETYLPMLGIQNSTLYSRYSEVFDMISNGKYGYTIQHYKGGKTGNGMFQTEGIIIDGGRLKTEPWLVFEELENKLGLKPYFNENRFTKRADGYYCVKLEISKRTDNTSMDCMPATKGIIFILNMIPFCLNLTLQVHSW